MAAPKAAKTSHRRIAPPRISHCRQGHEIFRYLWAPVFGRRQFRWGCHCEILPMVTK